MRFPSSLWRLVSASVCLLLFTVIVSATPKPVPTPTPCPSPTAIPSPTPDPSPTFKLHLANGELTASDTSTPTNKLPVLFVHGHNPSESDDPPNFKNNWQSPMKTLLVSAVLASFQHTLNHPENSSLGIEQYYIQFLSQEHSVAHDAAAIGAAIERILHRHDPEYPARPTTNVRVVIIAYSKGTISARLYLKNLAAENRSLSPVSEFIAIAPPNHGVNSSDNLVGASTAGEQLRNGYDEGCTSYANADSVDFITNLNGHSICDTKYDPNNPNPVLSFPEEAPGSRPPTGRPAEGILYVTLFADGNRDFVGGQSIIGPANSDCQGRRLALNLSPNAVNLPISGIDGLGEITFHQRTVHAPEVICKALYAAVHHRSPRDAGCSTREITVQIPRRFLPPESETAIVPIIEPPARAAAMLTLDFSGSMSTLAATNVSRASILKDSVELFIKLWSAVGAPNDRLGVTYFRTNVDEKEFAGDRLPYLSVHGTDVKDDVRTQAANDGTAMGGGLQRAIEALKDVTPDTPIRRVILFTDGIQNVNPMVVRNQGNQANPLVITNEVGRPFNSDVAPDVDVNNPIVLNSLLGVVNNGPPIVIDTIGIGSSGEFVTRLAEIAGDTNGFARTTVEAEMLRQFFVEELIYALKGFSPQLVAYRRGAVNAKGGTEAFAIENGVRKLVLKVSWQRGNSLDFAVARDGVDVTSAGRFIGGDFYKIFVIDLPASGRIAARGNWEVRIKGNAGTSYEAAAIVDGSPISYDSSFDLKRPRAGEPLDLVVRLTAGGQPVTDTRVSVTLLSPTITAGDIIAKNPPKDLPAFEPGMSIGERQLLALAQDPKRSAGLKSKSTKLEMQPTGKGDFRARLGTDVPGIYTAFVTIEGSNAQLGQFSRTMTITTVVRFANADRKASDIFASECDAGGGRRYVRLFLSPRDTKGHFMGPGSPSETGVELSSGRVVGTTRDLGGGSYAILLEVPAGVDPSITLKVAGAALFTGRLSQLSGKARR